jgi:hypothetical protein
MKKLSKFSGMVLAVATVAGGLASCSQEDTGLVKNDGRITFTSYLPLSRASQDVQSTQIANGVKVGVFVTGTDGEYINNGNNNLITADGAGGFTATTQLYWPSNGSANIYAYAPYNSDWTSQGTKTFSVAVDQTTDAAYLASDLLFGVPTANPVSATENAVPLVFKHTLSKININLVSNDENVSFKNSSVTIVGVAGKSAIDLTTGAVDEAYAEGSSDIKVAAFGEEETEFKCAGVIVPQTVKAGAFLLISNGEKAYSCSLAQDMQFQSGLVYNFTVTVNGTQADLNLDSTITDWENGGSSDLDPEEVVPPVEYAVGDYLLADGTMVKKSAYTDGEIIGVVFSTTVSNDDQGEGYKGYILGVSNALTSGVAAYGVDKESLYTEAAKTETLGDTEADLNGLKITRYYLNTTGLTISDNSVFKKAQGLAKVEADNISEWFVPSVGQMIQILNNLGNANITFNGETTHNAFFASNAAGEVNDYSVFTGLDKSTLIENVSTSTNGKLKLGDTATYQTASYRGNNYCYGWAVNFKASDLTFTGADAGWALQCGSDISAAGKRAVFCVAYK